jgi:type II secretory pathway pseudopilin PulG
MPDFFKPFRFRHGFNLVEAAVVLGVVGLIIGGIWVAASAVQKQHRYTRMVNGMLAINASLRNLYRGQDTTGYIRIDLNPTLLTELTKNVDGFRMSASNLGGTYFYNPFDQPQNLRIDSNRIVWDMSNLETADCLKMAALISSAGKTELYAMRVGATTYYSFPLDPATLDCSSHYFNAFFNF